MGLISLGGVWEGWTADKWIVEMSVACQYFLSFTFSQLSVLVQPNTRALPNITGRAFISNCDFAAEETIIRIYKHVDLLLDFR